MTEPTSLAYLFGDDDLALERAIRRIGSALGEPSGPLERWDLRANRTVSSGQIGELRVRVGTSVLFGGGTIAVVWNPGALTVKTEDRDALLGIVSTVAPGNALVIVEQSATGAKGPGQAKLADAIKTAGGVVRAHESPKEGALTAWIDSEARDLGIRLAPGAAKELARRIGGFVREGDADRRDQTRRAFSELEKLGLYRAGESVTVDDVAELVAEAIPGSGWALADAVGDRNPQRAMEILDILADASPELVIVAILHRRIRELIEVLDRSRHARTAAEIGRPMGIQSAFRVERLVEQARRWQPAELAAALDGLLEIEAIVKGAPGRGSGDAQRRLAFTLWIADHVDRLVGTLPPEFARLHA
jgi:DNA polymerase III delta subunit